MAIINKRKSITANPSDDRIKDNLKENFKRFINEADEDLEDEDLGGEEDMEDMDGMDDLGGEDLSGEEGMDDLGDDLGGDLGGEEDMDNLEGGSTLDNLTDTESLQVDHWIDELLGDTLEQASVAGGTELDTETMASDLDPMGEEQYVHDDLPMTTDDITNIIDSDDSLAALEQELADLAIEHAGEDTEGLGGESLEDEGLEDESLEDEELEDEELEEAENPMKGIDKYFDQGFEGEDVQDGLQEDVELAPINKKIGMNKTTPGLNDKMTSKVSPTPGSRTAEEIKSDAYNVVKESKESKKKSAMLVEAAGMIAEMKKRNVKQAKLIESLKLDNYKLIKTNGLLSVVGDQLSREARTQISESFDKCQNVEQVNKFYSKLTEKIKNASRPSLNTTVNDRRTKINVIKESVNKTKTAEISHEQERRNMLMGLSTKNDVYFQ